jgi:hypothetical protein
MRAVGVVSAAGALLLCAGLAPAQQGAVPASELYQFRVAYDQFQSQLTGVARRGAAGTLVDVKEDLSIDDKRTWDVRAALQVKPGHKLRGSYLKLDYEGSAAPARGLVYGESVFLAGEPVVTSVNGNYITAEYELDFSRGTWGYVGALAGAKMFDFDSVLVAEERGVREVETTRKIVPSLGLALRFYMNRISLTGEASGFTYGSKGHVIEADGIARIHLSDRFAVEGGYRYLKAKGGETEDLVDVELQGWIWGVEMSL